MNARFRDVNTRFSCCGVLLFALASACCAGGEPNTKQPPEVSVGSGTEGNSASGLREGCGGGAVALEPQVVEGWMAAWGLLKGDFSGPDYDGPEEDSALKSRICGEAACAPGELVPVEVLENGSDAVRVGAVVPLEDGKIAVYSELLLGYREYQCSSDYKTAVKERRGQRVLEATVTTPRIVGVNEQGEDCDPDGDEEGCQRGCMSGVRTDLDLVVTDPKTGAVRGVRWESGGKEDEPADPRAKCP